MTGDEANGAVPDWHEAMRLKDLLRLHAVIAHEVALVEPAAAYAARFGKQQYLLREAALAPANRLTSVVYRSLAR